MQASFPYNERTLSALRRAISAPRLHSYELMAEGDLAQALRLYQWNISLSQALYGPLQSVEVTLRNMIHRRLTAAFGANWYENPRVGLRHSQAQRVWEAKEGLVFQQKLLEPPSIVAVLGFGFWVGLLGSKYETHLWRPYLRHLFIRPEAPLLRRRVHQELDEIRQLRNRVAHHERILHLPLHHEYRRIFTVLNWLCPVTAYWAGHFTRFDAVYRAKP